MHTATCTGTADLTGPDIWDKPRLPFLDLHNPSGGEHIPPHNRVIWTGAGILLYIAIACVIAACLSSLYSDPWNSYDAGLFHSMADVIRTGLTPYVDFTDNKPPLLFFTIALIDSLVPAGTIDMPLMASLNVIAALLVWKVGKEEYGDAAGFSAGFLYLVAAVAVQGYFLFSEQFVIVLVLGAFVVARARQWAAAGILMGLAIGFKQYAVLGCLPFLYMMWADGDRHFHRFLLPVAAVVAGMFGALLVWYGQDVALNAVYYTFGVGPQYLMYGYTGGAMNIKPSGLMFFAIILVSVASVLPTLVFASASVGIHGVRSITDRTILLFVLSFGLSLFVRQFLHYWILMLPFLALLACREFGRKARNAAEPQ